MAKLIVLYGKPTDQAAFEDYYANQHIPFAVEHMPNVTGAQNLRVIATPDGTAAPLYRISQMSYDSLDDLQSGITSADGQAVLADLDNFATGGTNVLIVDE